ncbi:BREX-3 system P-loop-containing protein BrxF [Caldicoprobacter algeriensis]|uniref:BREX-3 system P-loop-containing protein BrxF n=1 Tax=Caldicoprobacter algeriensis TaxID=699281 RepID=UPI00207AC58A|nr:BREX-3 system P-loop-containing protein BrxF [Caldicoprobacter algeriensis]MCM8899932.1 BREX-3 system P-loop-containing protein BrxF [Caldicoprobacter algeriensis]
MEYVNDQLSLKQVAQGYTSNAGNVMIACVDKELVKSFFSNWKWINLGLVVSEQLCRLPKEQRKKMVADIVINTVKKEPSKSIVLENIDVLFSPEYSLDVIRTLQLAGKNKRLLVIWAGEYEDGMLTYAKPDCPDFHRYEIRNYGVSCITK